MCFVSVCVHDKKTREKNRKSLGIVGVCGFFLYAFSFLYLLFKEYLNSRPKVSISFIYFSLNFVAVIGGAFIVARPPSYSNSIFL